MSEPKFTRLVNLADARLGAVATYVTDDWFADVNRMLQPTPAVWKEGVYDDCGKWMDGWESRRKRFEGYDFAIVRLGVTGSIEGVSIDTAFFTGNYPPSASLDAIYSPNGDPSADDTGWENVLSAVDLKGNSVHFHEISGTKAYTHIRLNIFPDGGIARLRVYGTPHRDWNELAKEGRIDLVASLNGGRALACSDEHFGKMANILNPGRGVNMGDGWETARRRVPGNDWVILALGNPGVVEEILVDTCHFKGNYPDSCSIQAAYVKGGTDDQIATQSLFWRELLPNQKLSMDAEHTFTEVNDLGPITHVKLNVYPDGGVSRLRLFGKPIVESK
jgi:allantoicase